MNIISFEDREALPTEKHWKNSKTANQAMVHLINMMKDPVYVETGVYDGKSISFITQRCLNIKEAWGVDFWLPNTDHFEQKETFYSEDMQKRSFEVACRRAMSTGHKDKIKFIKEDVSVAASYFEDNSIDFLFLDHYLNQKDVAECLPMWYNKVKLNGYFAGHDWLYEDVGRSVLNFREQYAIQSTLSVYGAEWVWKKDGNI
jgi:hypothetical protein